MYSASTAAERERETFHQTLLIWKYHISFSNCDAAHKSRALYTLFLRIFCDPFFFIIEPSSLVSILPPSRAVYRLFQYTARIFSESNVTFLIGSRRWIFKPLFNSFLLASKNNFNKLLFSSSLCVCAIGYDLTGWNVGVKLQNDVQQFIFLIAKLTLRFSSKLRLNGYIYS